MDAFARPSPPTLDEILDERGWTPRGSSAVGDELRPWSFDTALRLALDLAGERIPADLAPWRRSLYVEGRRRLFPQRFAGQGEEVTRVASYFFPLAEGVIGEQVRRGGDRIAVRMPFRPLAEAEMAPWPSAEEYGRLLRAISDDGLLAVLALGQEWLGFSIADHVLGVTGLSLWVARQLARSVPVDLPLLHGAAIGHDIGKFGCIGDEERRIPRLHYYYTHMYYEQRGLPGLGHIATNHSCWDLERIRLPIETQLLIYADFRVKEEPAADGSRRMALISLNEAFDAIRDKLENLDRAKLRRYEAAYAKLRDLEDYLVQLGVELDPPGFATPRPPRPRVPRGLDMVGVLTGAAKSDVVALATGKEVSTVSRLFATAHTVAVMEKLRDVPALRGLLEEARSFEGWRDLRTYLGVLGEYAAALSMPQRQLAVDFFFELLAHRDDDIRYHAANRIGDLLALGEDRWRKDLPDGVVPPGDEWVPQQLERVLSLLDRANGDDDDNMGATERVLYAVPLILRRLVRFAPPEARRAILDLVYERFMARAGDTRALVGLYVCESFEVLIPFLPLEHMRELVGLARTWTDHPADNTRLMAWRLLVWLARAGDDHAELLDRVRPAAEDLAGTATASMLVAELFLLEEMTSRTGLAAAAGRCRSLREDDRQPLREVMLRDLKTSTGWVEKKVNGDYLVAAALERSTQGSDAESLFAAETAAHLANVLKVSRVEGARFHAGRCLLRLLPVLSIPQRNDLAVELTRSLQLDAEAITRYIPRFLGSVLASLPEHEFLELIDDIETHVRRGAEPLQRLLLQTVGWVVLSLPSDRLDDRTMRALAGMLLGALAETRASTVHEGYAQIAMILGRILRKGQHDDRLSVLLRVTTKSLLSLVTHRPDDRGRFFLVASALNHLERALDRARPRVRFAGSPSVAFLPGTFDPFTRGHREVVSRALEHVDEILVQIDDYSWRKHAQPRQVRRELAWMALAAIPEAFQAPFDPPLNLANPESVAALRKRIGSRPLWIVVGSDVLEGASAYRDPSSPLWDLNHLVVVRGSHRSRAWRRRLPGFRGEYRIVNVSHRVKGVSSTSVRSVLDGGGDLEPLCDPLVARTLLERRLYLHYPSRKKSVQAQRFSLEPGDAESAAPRGFAVLSEVPSLPSPARWSGRRCESLVLRARDGHAAQATLSWREASSAALAVELGDRELAVLPEKWLVGPGALVDRIAMRPKSDPHCLDVLLSQTMIRWLDAGLMFALAAVDRQASPALARAFETVGATWLNEAVPDGGASLWAAMKLSQPLVLVWDLEQALQPPFAAQERIVRRIAVVRHALARYFAARGGGGALLHLYERETKRAVVEWAERRILDAGGNEAWVVLGLGRQFHRDLVGDCPTIALDLERCLSWQGYEGGVHAAAGSPSLELQLHTAHELGRQAILLVPFLDSEDAVLAVIRAAREVGLPLREVLIGVTNATVHAALHLADVPHRCAAVIPRWQGVVRESALMPYLGGWSILDRDLVTAGSLQPSLNDCLPYHFPHPIGLDAAAALDFSRLVLDHTRDLLRELEDLFREREGRLLSLHDLGMVVRTPRCPPFPRGFVPPFGRVPSELLEDDLEALARLHPERHSAHRARWRQG